MKVLGKIKGYIWAFLIPVLFLILWLTANNILGTRTNAVVVSDMYHQYMVLFDHLKEIFNGGSIFYTFSKGLGGNMTGSIAYYLLSPLNLLSLLFSKVAMEYGCMIIILIKLGLCGLTMFIFLKNNFKKLSLLPLLMFSTSYALMMFNIGYFFNVMWLDGVALAPIVLLGLERLIDGKKPLLYGITLLFIIIFNYYIGYIICLFITIYYIYKMLLKYKWSIDKQTIKKITLTFIITSLLAGITSMFILIPTFSELSETVRSVGSAFSKPLTVNFDFIGLISEFFVGISRKKILLNPSSFFLYTGIINFILMFFYFFNKKISLKERLLSLGVLSIFIISFMCNYVNYFWHGMAAPNDFNGRYTFLFSFYIIYLSCRTFIHLDGVKKIMYFIIAPIFPIVGLIINLRGLLDIEYAYITTSLALLYLLILYLIAHREGKEHKQLIMMLCAIAISELFFNAYADLSHYQLIRNKVLEGKYDDYQSIVNFVQENDDNVFYRMDFNKHVINNDPLYFGYKGVNSFVSSTNARVSNFYTKIGCYGSQANLTYNCFNYMSDSLLGLKYVGLLSGESDLYKLIFKREIKTGDELFYGFYSEPMNMYYNPYALSLGFMANNDILKFNDEYKKISNNSLSYQNLIFKLMNDHKKDVLIPISSKKISDLNYEFINNDNTKDLYIALNYDNFVAEQEVKIELNDEWLTNYFSTKHYNNYFRNVFDKNEKINVKINLEFIDYLPKPKIDAKFYYIDEEAFKDIINELKQEELKVLVENGEYLKGTINVTSDKKVLFTTIPYEKGWTIYVDGKKTNYYPVIDTFIGLNLDKGNHTIEFKFYPPGLNKGLIISGIALSLLILYFIYFKKITNLVFERDK